MLGTSAQGLTMTIPPALTMFPETGRVTVTVPWPLFVVLVLAPPACTIWAPAKLAAGMVIIPANGSSRGVKTLPTGPRRQKTNTGGGRRGLTLLQHSSVRVDGLIDDRLSVSSLGHLLALHTNLLALQDQITL